MGWSIIVRMIRSSEWFSQTEKKKKNILRKEMFKCYVWFAKALLIILNQFKTQLCYENMKLLIWNPEEIPENWDMSQNHKVADFGSKQRCSTFFYGWPPPQMSPGGTNPPKLVLKDHLTMIFRVISMGFDGIYIMWFAWDLHVAWMWC